jgi:hypothetical protein
MEHHDRGELSQPKDKGKVPLDLEPDTPQRKPKQEGGHLPTKSGNPGGDDGPSDDDDDDGYNPRNRNPNQRSANAPRPQKGTTERRNLPIPKLDKLEGANDFQSWINSIKKYLQMQEVEGKFRYTYWDVVKGDLLRPTTADTIEIETTKEDWVYADNHAYLTIRRNCEKEPHTLIRLCKTSHEAYKTLVTHYENKMISDLGIVLTNVTSCRYTEESTIHEHINAFEVLWENLFATSHGPLKPADKIFGKGLRIISSNDRAKRELLLATFPPRYHQTVQNLRTKDDYTYGDIVANLKMSIRKPTWIRTTTGAGNGSRKDPIVLRNESGGPNNGRGKQEIDTSKTCGYCIKVKKWRGIGHTENECRTKARERGNAGGPNPGVRRIDSKAYEESEDDFELDQGARITEIHTTRIHMIKAGKVDNIRNGQYEFDTGAQVHTTNELWRLRDRKSPGATITACNGTKTTAEFEGTLYMIHKGRPIILHNVMYHPSFYNLISGQRIKSFNLTSKGTTAEVSINGKTLYHIDRDIKGTMWIKPDDRKGPENGLIKWPKDVHGAKYDPSRTIDPELEGQKASSLMELHERYGHISFDTLKSLPEAQKFRGTSAPKCEACIIGKSTKPSAKATKGIPTIRSTKALERIHADLIGPLKVWLGKRYILTIIDDFTRYCGAIPIRAKSDTKSTLIEWIRAIENQCGQKVQQIQADWGGEFRNNELATWCKKKGIRLKETVPHHSEHQQK